MAERKKLRIIFMGTPGFAATILDELLNWKQGEILCCYTQPDRPSGRGQKVRQSDVKQLALKHGIAVRQPLNFKNQDDIQALRALRPDVLLVAAYGLILPQTVLDIPPFGAINVHASLLPKYRGAAPIQRALQNGDKVTGISIMQMEKGLDTGPVLLQRSLGVSPDEHAGTIHNQLADMGGRLLIETLDTIVGNGLHPQRQDDSLATYAAKIEKHESQINWNQPALHIHNTIRAFYPFPGTWFLWQTPTGKELRLNLVPGKIGQPCPAKSQPGTILGLEDDMLTITCRDFLYMLPSIKPAGKSLQTAKAFYCGYLSHTSGAS